MLTSDSRPQFALLLRILHWLMAALLLAMLFIGFSMVTSLKDCHRLLAVHRPLGVLILILAAVRLGTRWMTVVPASPAMSAMERFVARTSEAVLYALFFALPLVGWGVLSAGHYPVTLFGSIHLPAILPANPALYTVLRESHTVLAVLLVIILLAHIGAVLFHTLILRDGLLGRMLPWKTRGIARR